MTLNGSKYLVLRETTLNLAFVFSYGKVEMIVLEGK